MKKFIAFILIFALTILVGCGGEQTSETIDATGIKINGEQVVKVDETIKLTATVEPSNATDKLVEWSTSDSTIATVTDGTVKGISEGTVTITVSLKNNNAISNSLEVTVEKKDEQVIVETKLELTQSNVEVFAGEEVDASSFVTITNIAPGMTLSYKSDNEAVAKVDSNGKITTLGKGTAKIEITLNGSGLDPVILNINVKEVSLEISGGNSVVAGNTLQLSLKVNGSDVTGATWNSEETKVATVDANGLLTSLSEGSVVISATYNGNTIKTTITVTSNKVKPTAIEVSYQADKELFIDTPVKITHTVTPANASNSVKYKSSNEKIATVDENGNVTFIKGGEVVITVTSTLSSKVSASITLNPLNYIDPIKFFQDYNVGTVSQQYISHISFNIFPYTVSLLRGTISYFYFDELEIITTYPVLNKPGTLRTATWFITVHDTADGADASGTGKGTALWNQQSEDSSWHYSIGNDGVWAGVPEREVAWHAGDGTGTQLTWTDTGVKAEEEVPAVVTISDDNYWVVNGVKTELKQTVKKSDGTYPTNADLPYTGINTRIGNNGNYYIGNVWWSNTYKTLSNRGGNLNSIGMETAINESANLEDVWHKTAKLCGDLVTRFNLHLGVGAIKQHNTFSGKNCPQTMRTAGRWEYFIKMCEAEWKARKYLYEFDFELICNSELVNEKGQVIKFNAEATDIEYSVRITSTKYNYDETVTLKVTIPAAIQK